MARRLVNSLPLGCAVVAGLLAVGAGPANAERIQRIDPAGDMTGFTESADGVTATPAPSHQAGDITSLIVRHGPRAVTMKVNFAQLHRTHFNAFFGQLRTSTLTRQLFVEDGRGSRPRLSVVNKRFRPVCSGATLHVDYHADTFAIRVPRACLERPDWVKAIAMSANGADASNTFYIDDAFTSRPVEDPDGRPTWSRRVHRL